MSDPIKLPCTVYRLRMATRRATRLYDACLAPCGLGIAQFGLLHILRSHPGASVTTLAEALDTDRTTMTRNLAPLAKAGLVQLGPGPDKRTRAVVLTASGQAVLERAYPLWRQAQSRVREVLGKERVDALHAMLDAATAELPDSINDGATSASQHRRGRSRSK